MLKKVVIFLGYSCNNYCIFCIEHDKRHIKDKTFSEIVKEIYLAKKQNVDVLEFIGGEITIRDDFIDLIKFTKKIGIKDIVCVTNGRMFTNLDFAISAVKAGLTTIIFSVHGHCSQVHDQLTNVNGSFSQLINGIYNLKKIGFKNINANTTVVKQNMIFLPEIAKLYVKLKIKNVEYIFVDPTYGGAHNNFHEIVPKISEASKWMKEALFIGRKNNYYQWYVRYVPLCLFKGYTSQVSELQEIRLFHTQHWASDFNNFDVSSSRKLFARKKTNKCKNCILYDKCEGLWKFYIEKYGDSELIPVLKK